jgi:hypothetical protein
MTLQAKVNFLSVQYSLFVWTKGNLKQLCAKSNISGHISGMNPSLKTQSCIKGLLVVRDFCFWAVWAAGPILKTTTSGLIMTNF